MSRTSTISSWSASNVVVSTSSGVDPQPGEELRVGPGHPGRGAAQAVPVGVLADRDQDLPYRPLDPGEVDRVLDRAAAEPAVDQPRGE